MNFTNSPSPNSGGVLAEHLIFLVELAEFEPISTNPKRLYIAIFVLILVIDLFPLNCRRWLTRNIVHDAVNVIDFIDDPHWDLL